MSHRHDRQYASFSHASRWGVRTHRITRQFSTRSPQCRPVQYRTRSPESTPAIQTGSASHHLSRPPSLRAPAGTIGISSGIGTPRLPSKSAKKIPRYPKYPTHASRATQAERKAWLSPAARVYFGLPRRAYAASIASLSFFRSAAVENVSAQYPTSLLDVRPLTVIVRPTAPFFCSASIASTTMRTAAMSFLLLELCHHFPLGLLGSTAPLDVAQLTERLAERLEGRTRAE